MTEDRVRGVIDNRIEGRDLGFLGEPRVNVLELNLALDEQFGRPLPQPATAAVGSGRIRHVHERELYLRSPAVCASPIVDDEKNIRATLAVCVEGLGAEALAVGTGDAALAAIGRQPYDLAFVDLALGTESGLDLLPKLLGEEASLAIVLITAYGTIETAVEAMRRGAWDYLPKPFTPAQIRHLIEKFKTQRHLTARVAEARTPPGRGGPRRRDRQQVGGHARRAGHGGAGRRHRRPGPDHRGEPEPARATSPAPSTARARDAAPFKNTNCPTLSEELLASELFGRERCVHRRGPQSGGPVEVAEGGTLFLDEVGEIPPSLQSKLLVFCRRKARGSARRAPGTATCASSPPPTGTWRPTSKPAASGRSLLSLERGGGADAAAAGAARGHPAAGARL